MRGKRRATSEEGGSLRGDGCSVRDKGFTVFVVAARIDQGPDRSVAGAVRARAYEATAGLRRCSPGSGEPSA